ncbi:MAG: MEDS domain-containing protein [Nitrosomonas sp.]|nr:MEDS domain-containing protein [Nitrosomonas sp.]
MNTNILPKNAFSLPKTGNHIVQICQNQTSQAEILTQYVKEGLANGEGVVIIARPALRKAVISKMDALGLDVHAFKSQGQIKFFDAEFLLAGFLIDGVLDEQTFQQFVASPILATQLKFGKVRAFGEMVDVLWKNDLQDLAIELESLWDELCNKHELMFLCTYLLDSLDPNNYDNSLERICKCHTHSLPINSFNPVVGGAMLELFGAAWSNVVSKIEESKNISNPMPPALI